MRYTARARLDALGWSAIVTSDSYDAVNGHLAMRHARAMLEVQRAARAWAKATKVLERAYERNERCSAGAPMVQRHLDACARLMKAHERLSRVEKEVSRG